MNSLATKFKSLVLLALVAGLSLQCEKKEENQDTVTAATLAALLYSPGDCTVNAPPRASINTFTTAISANGSGTITQTGTVPVVGHKTGLLKLTAKINTTVSLTGNAFVIVYQSSSCPLTTSTRTNVTFTGLTDSNSRFTNSYELTSSGSVRFDVAGDYYIFIYAIPPQSANISYSVTGL